LTRSLVAGLGGIVQLALFVGMQARREEPLMRVGPFKAHDLAAANAAQFSLSAAFMPMCFLFNPYSSRSAASGPPSAAPPCSSRPDPPRSSRGD